MVSRMTSRRPVQLRNCLLLCVLALTPNPASGQDSSADSKPDYRNPARVFSKVKRGERTFVVEKQLLDEDMTTANKALDRLNANIDLALAILPRHAHEHVAKQNFWLLYGPKSTGGGRDNGLAYFRPGSPKFDEKRHEDWNSVVVVYDAQNYVSLTDLWALKAVLHELGHAYQLEQWPEKEPNILAAYENAMQGKLYHNVKNDKGGRFPKAYATQNQLEYFAELTCMFFAGCNYDPMKRSNLKTYDPTGYEMMRKMWKVGDRHGKHEPRTWKLGRAGKALSATFQSSTKTSVTLVDPAGRTRTISLSALSPLDQEYMLRWNDD